MWLLCGGVQEERKQVRLCALSHDDGEAYNLPELPDGVGERAAEPPSCRRLACPRPHGTMYGWLAAAEPDRVYGVAEVAGQEVGFTTGIEVGLDDRPPPGEAVGVRVTGACGGSVVEGEEGGQQQDDFLRYSGIRIEDYLASHVHRRTYGNASRCSASRVPVKRRSQACPPCRSRAEGGAQPSPHAPLANLLSPPATNGPPTSAVCCSTSWSRGGKRRCGYYSALSHHGDSLRQKELCPQGRVPDVCSRATRMSLREAQVFIFQVRRAGQLAGQSRRICTHPAHSLMAACLSTLPQCLQARQQQQQQPLPLPSVFASGTAPQQPAPPPCSHAAGQRTHPPYHRHHHHHTSRRPD